MSPQSGDAVSAQKKKICFKGCGSAHPTHPFDDDIAGDTSGRPSCPVPWSEVITEFEKLYKPGGLWTEYLNESQLAVQIGRNFFVSGSVATVGKHVLNIREDARVIFDMIDIGRDSGDEPPPPKGGGTTSPPSTDPGKKKAPAITKEEWREFWEKVFTNAQQQAQQEKAKKVVAKVEAPPKATAVATTLEAPPTTTELGAGGLETVPALAQAPTTLATQALSVGQDEVLTPPQQPPVQEVVSAGSSVFEFTVSSSAPPPQLTFDEFVGGAVGKKYGKMAMKALFNFVDGRGGAAPDGDGVITEQELIDVGTSQCRGAL